MAAGRAVVATDVGGAREMIAEGETGHLVAAGDDEALAERVASLLAEPERARRMGERGRRVVAEKFSCGAQLARIESLYEALFAEKAARAAGARSGKGRGGARTTEV
jgi:glycosyltransferase involved in cell wall biosynthesis